MKLHLGALGLLLLSFSLSGSAQNGRTEAANWDSRFHLTSSTFENRSTLPISMMDNITVNGSNACSVDGSPGGDESPELSWGHAKAGTRSLVVIAFDKTAAFTHWGMYNISAQATGLPENAGIAGSKFGDQIVNDFFFAAEYDGPCPSVNVQSFAHRYVFTVYALDVVLHLPSPANFPASAETLCQALIQAGKDGHILESSSIVGFYSATPPQ